MCSNPLLHSILVFSMYTPLNAAYKPSPVILISFPFSVFIESFFAGDTEMSERAMWFSITCVVISSSDITPPAIKEVSIPPLGAHTVNR